MSMGVLPEIETDSAWNVCLGLHEETTGNPNDSFIRATTSGWGKTGQGTGCHVDADNGEIAVFEFPDVRAIKESGGLGSVCVRIRTNAPKE